MKKTYSVSNLRPNLLKVVNDANRLGEEFLITKNGEPVAVIVGYDEWESWDETMEILADKKALKRIQTNLSYYRRGGKGKTIAGAF
ncbi:MAG: type II toxin-antitoxin system Phd/YefM family antitoxin [Deltaproteobacteria bacterium]|jgi:prevent-host-death family protein|nr:type II toxin-antitoxin system Phd/YefM family antitoxin [Deltaproteobacteria bacterium]